MSASRERAECCKPPQTDVAVPSGSVWTLLELVPARVLSGSCTEAMSETHTSISLDITVTEKSHGRDEKTPGLILKMFYQNQRNQKWGGEGTGQS